jgi:hypothetical protein
MFIPKATKGKKGRLRCQVCMIGTSLEGQQTIGGAMVSPGNMEVQPGLQASTTRLSMGPHKIPEIHLFSIGVILSGNCVPLCSSPSMTGTVNPGLHLLTFGRSSGRANSNCLMRVTKNECISTTLEEVVKG